MSCLQILTQVKICSLQAQIEGTKVHMTLMTSSGLFSQCPPEPHKTLYNYCAQINILMHEFSIFSVVASSLQELCCTVSPWPGVKINSPGSCCMLLWCSSHWSSQSWGCARCLTSITTTRFPTSTPCTAGLGSLPQLFSPYRYTNPHADTESFYVFFLRHDWAQVICHCANRIWGCLSLHSTNQWVVGLAGFLLPCSPASLRKRLKPVHVWMGGSILWLSIAACISGINEKLFFVLWVLYSSVTCYSYFPSR